MAAPSHSMSHRPCCSPPSWPTRNRPSPSIFPAISIAVLVCKVGSPQSILLQPLARAAQMMSWSCMYWSTQAPLCSTCNTRSRTAAQRVLTPTLHKTAQQVMSQCLIGNEKEFCKGTQVTAVSLHHTACQHTQGGTHTSTSSWMHTNTAASGVTPRSPTALAPARTHPEGSEQDDRTRHQKVMTHCHRSMLVSTGLTQSP